MCRAGLNEANVLIALESNHFIQKQFSHMAVYTFCATTEICFIHCSVWWQLSFVCRRHSRHRIELKCTAARCHNNFFNVSPDHPQTSHMWLWNLRTCCSNFSSDPQLAAHLLNVHLNGRPRLCGRSEIQCLKIMLNHINWDKCKKIVQCLC